MTWFKVDDSFHSHPKTMATSLEALGLWAVAGSWSSANLTDGFVPDHVLRRLSLGRVELAEELVVAGLWRRTKGGHRFHDWHGYQPTKESVLSQREAWREKKSKQRAKPSNPTSNNELSPGDTQGDTPGDSRGSHAGVSPSRSRPVPVSPNGDTSPPSGAPPRKRGTTRGTRIPDDFTVTPEMVTWARERVPGVDGRTETEKFINYWRGKSGKDATKVEWDATWRNWMLNAAERVQTRPANGYKPNADDTIRELLGVPAGIPALPGGEP